MEDALKKIVRWVALVDTDGRVQFRQPYTWGDSLVFGPSTRRFTIERVDFLDNTERAVLCLRARFDGHWDPCHPVICEGDKIDYRFTVEP